MTVSVYPELVTGRSDRVALGPWTVDQGSSRRGDASCNLSERILRVPLGSDGCSRIVRAHELMHIRVSPVVRATMALPFDVAFRAVECAEEYRVNALLARQGFDVGQLLDGTEKLGGQRLALEGNWSEAVCFYLAVLGTGAEKPYLSGVRRSNASWMAALRILRRRVLQIESSFTATRLSSTTLGEDDLPLGFAEFTLPLARLITLSMSARVPRSPDELRRFRRSLEPGGRRPPTGCFAQLVIDESLPMFRPPLLGGERRSVPAVSGTVMRYPSRLLLDDQQRAFRGRRNTNGGIVIIDHSGSMNMEVEELWALLRKAPRALIVGYSHRPGDHGATSNAWIIARDGSVARECPTGHTGNGVDGPILEWAIRQRHGREPLVWVTDGQVTDSHDHPDTELSRHCANLVIRHQIRMVTVLAQVPALLSARMNSRTTRWSDFGRVGREILEMKAN